MLKQNFIFVTFILLIAFSIWAHLRFERAARDYGARTLVEVWLTYPANFIDPSPPSLGSRILGPCVDTLAESTYYHADGTARVCFGAFLDTLAARDLHISPHAIKVEIGEYHVREGFMVGEAYGRR